jgi:hypothetical protein
VKLRYRLCTDEVLAHNVVTERYDGEAAKLPETSGEVLMGRRFR